jgi:hypothetical protein
MKKIVALAIVAGFALSFAACGKKAEEAPAQEAAPAEQAEQPAQDSTQQASDSTQQQ